MLQITLDSNDSNNTYKTHEKKNWSFKVKIIKESENSEMILSFEEEINPSTNDDSSDQSPGLVEPNI
ncbi:MAG: hypothetical protein HZA74_02740 [Ignavibacteriales bacterium]|jgi:hypothetical protein|nr:hypothetical protein [Ignavibacteriales bacterium]